MTQFNPLATHADPGSIATGHEARLLFRDPSSPPFLQTTGMAPGYMQASPIILPGELALDFATFCQRNPKPCPLVATSSRGAPTLPTLGADLDLRTDIGGYRIWRHGELVDEVTDIAHLWRDDFVGFAVGCSYSFEEALVSDGIELRHLSEGVCVPMYMTDLPLEPSGPFRGRMCVTMRPMAPKDAIRAIEITSRFPLTHGTPVHIGDPRQIGIEDLATPLVGDAVEVREGEICVFWGCSITPQYAMLQAKPEIAITHKPGCLLLTDVPSRADAIDLPSLAA
ncbi:MAG: putative hydro-lyase [Alphaproteobacteria bacterium]|jgi:uncharacterized protein YcsI (UPF0317 family)|nr:putative hydro-lyase [Alphaproteobacteria bacterium]